MKIKKVAKKLQKMGKGGDTILAHINPEEAAVLKAGGGSGKKNPDTGLLSFGGYEGGGTDMGGDYGGPEPGQGMGSVNEAAFGGFGGKPGEDAMAQAAASQSAMSPDAYAGLQQAMIDAMGTQDSGLVSSILGGLFGPIGGIAGKMGLGDKLSQAWNERDIMNTPYGGSGGGFFSGGDGGNLAVNEHGGDSPAGGGYIPSALGNPAPAAPQLPAFQSAPITQQPFVSKWGKPRTRGYFGS